MNWTEHYADTTTYTHGYYRELSPTVITTALQTRGLRAPDLSTALNYCELGMGFGVSLVANAACFPQMRFYGNDFNPQHAAYARALADDAKLENVEVFDDSFEEMLERDLPPMDFIVLHGIYSWVSPRTRQVIVAFIAKRLRLGGVVYVSHNTLPGWAELMPLRELIRLHGWRMSPQDMPLAERARRAIDFVDELARLEPACFAANPAALQRLAQLRNASPAYMAHEYFNPEWHPLHLHEVAAEMAVARLGFAGSAQLEDHVEGAWLPPAALRHVAAASDPVMRETLRDHHLNRAFRRDLYSRGAMHASPIEQQAEQLARRWALTEPREGDDADLTVGAGDERVDANQCALLLDALADGPRSVQQLLHRPESAALGAGGLMKALLLLSGHGRVQPALSEVMAETAQAGAYRFNAVALARAGDDGLNHVVSPLTGQAMGWTRLAMHQMQLCQQGVTDATVMARAVQAHASARGLAIGGQPADSEAGLSALVKQSDIFLTRELPTLAALGIL